MPSIVYLVSEDWYFVSHRLPMARAAKHMGYDVHVATNVSGHAAAIEAEGFHLHRLRWRRGSINPLNLIGTVRQVRALYRRMRPDIAHHVALEAVVIGSLASMGLPVKQLNALAGLGYTFTSSTAKARLTRMVLRTVLRRLLKSPRNTVLVQNADDGAIVKSLGVPPERVALIPGSGVDVDEFQPLAEPSEPVTAAFAGRLLAHKGVRVLVAAHDILMQRRANIRLLLAGDIDPASPASIEPAEIADWRSRPGLVVMGHVADIREVWGQAHIAVQPSIGGEGLPKSLLEAAACGRPIVASDVAGCRDIARDGGNALLVPPGDPAALADAIARLAADRDLRLQLGAAGRRLVEKEFSSARVGRETVALYGRMLTQTTAPAATTSIPA